MCVVCSVQFRLAEWCLGYASASHAYPLYNSMSLSCTIFMQSSNWSWRETSRKVGILWLHGWLVVPLPCAILGTQRIVYSTDSGFWWTHQRNTARLWTYFILHFFAHHCDQIPKGSWSLCHWRYIFPVLHDIEIIARSVAVQACDELWERGQHLLQIRTWPN